MQVDTDVFAALTERAAAVGQLADQVAALGRKISGLSRRVTIMSGHLGLLRELAGRWLPLGTGPGRHAARRHLLDGGWNATPAEQRYAQPAVEAYDNGRDGFAYEVGTAVRELIDDGAADSRVVEVVREMVSARMEVGLPRGDWFRS